MQVFKCKFYCLSLFTNDLEEITKSADILISAIGRPYFVTENMVRKDSIIIDVGINKVLNRNTKKSNFVGDVDYESVFKKVNTITPVAGGVGSVTTATLFSTIIKSTRLYEYWVSKYYTF